jgi:hypothetical protein
VINNDGGDNNHVDREHHSKREPPRSRSYYQVIANFIFYFGYSIVLDLLETE